MTRLLYLTSASPNKKNELLICKKKSYDVNILSKQTCNVLPKMWLDNQPDETLGFKISKLCFEGPEEELKLTKNTQPALLILSLVAYILLGKEPWIAAGHSLREYLNSFRDISHALNPSLTSF